MRRFVLVVLSLAACDDPRVRRDDDRIDDKLGVLDQVDVPPGQIADFTLDADAMKLHDLGAYVDEACQLHADRLAQRSRERSRPRTAATVALCESPASCGCSARAPAARRTRCSGS